MIEIVWEPKEKDYDRSYPIGSIGYISKDFILVETRFCIDEWICMLNLPNHSAYSILRGWSKGFATEKEAKDLAERALCKWIHDALGLKIS